MGKNKDEVKATEQEKALGDISQKQFARYQQVFAPFEDEWLRESRVSAGEKKRLSGHIGGDVEQAVGGGHKQLTGMNPAGGNFTAGMRDLAVGKGKAKAKAQSEGTMQAENADATALMSGVRLGRGQAVEAQAGMEQMAGMATSKAVNDAFTDRAERDATAGLVGSAVGAAAWGVDKFKMPSSGGMEWNGADTGGANYSLMRGTANATQKQQYSLRD
jgi:hypothetical protein